MGYQNEMTEKKTAELIKNGYDESDFDESYWTVALDDVPRVGRDPATIVSYFLDLFNKLNIKNPGTFIDICAGAGNTVNGFRNAGIDAQGCEFSSSGRKVAEERFGIILKPCDLRHSLPYGTNQFDWGMCVAAISMIPRKDMKNAISEIFRVVRRGVLFHTATAVGTFQGERLVNPHHLTAMSYDEFSQILKEINVFDHNHIHAPQLPEYGIGVNGEFSGLFSKLLVLNPDEK